MNAPGHISGWIETNQQALAEELVWLRRRMERAVDNEKKPSVTEDNETGPPGTTSDTLDFTAKRFGLSLFERSILLLCAGMELQSGFSRLCGLMHGAGQMNFPTFGLALSLLPEPHWSALTPGSPLRYWQLIQVDEAESLVTSRIRLDERILHFLFGSGSPDQRLSGLVHPHTPEISLVDSQLDQAKRVASIWGDGDSQPVIILKGGDTTATKEVAASGCFLRGLQSQILWAGDIPADPDRRRLLAILLAREYLLAGNVPVVDAAESEPPQLSVFIEQLACPVILLGKKPPALQRPGVTVDVKKPSAGEQRTLWRRELGDMAPTEEAELIQLASQFNFSAADIETVAKNIHREPPEDKVLKQKLWQQCCRHSREGLDRLAQRVTPRAGWDELILPRGPKAILRDMSRQVRHRATVYSTWGFAEKSERGLGICALFAGESGTGKTMAAEVLAADLNLDLYRIDLSAVVSKYIGETEKNLERLFATAETSGAILLFDEADALFGRRSEVKDSHDRYANIELAYLLQRMESYRGLSILTTNMKSALDTAFLRRIRFVVQFPFPDAVHRAEIWQNIFPENLPRIELRFDLLARLHLAGGNIRNIAMNAAFLAAEKNISLSMAELAYAARLEYAKLEKPINESELSKWT